MGNKRKLLEVTLAPLDETFDNALESTQGVQERVETHNSSSSQDTRKNKHCKIRKNISLKPVDLICEWNMCTRIFDKMEYFVEHIDKHINTDEVPPHSDGYLCFWRDCNSVLESKDEQKRHISFHGFHTKIKNIGSQYMFKYNLRCLQDNSCRNMIPQIPEDFICMWTDCKSTFNCVQSFYWHVQFHIKQLDKINDLYQCEWQDCKETRKNECRMRDHARTHSQEKVIGCPVCGGIYSCNTKFSDHCVRQIPSELKQHQCSHCSRKFSTERFLRDHVRHHINHFKCAQCDMTCPTKSTLTTHVKYRHSDQKLHKCQECNKRFKLSYDLTRHLTVHLNGPQYACLYTDCGFTSHSNSTLNIHIKRIHQGIKRKAHACHICDEKYINGAALTQHLINVHDFHWPAGHIRFRYKTDDDGYNRLQTVRYESIELNQGLNEEVDDVDIDDPAEFNLKPTKKELLSNVKSA